MSGTETNRVGQESDNDEPNEVRRVSREFALPEKHCTSAPRFTRGVSSEPMATSASYSLTTPSLVFDGRENSFGERITMIPDSAATGVVFDEISIG